ncbi:unnamed protein product (macronuclear) [Paramecium tetraurelia]|uniref:Uncharacterized protein n=1 Tax=Paramecium tetraurelia TaxID=5888 RepID=A0E0A4_PARTE|nr:uncharacterized protein GSPATT00021889001 [Paramecium tetraurelia]CAK88721.1 unnamed protein product [Paramecium tetraurelia]|eukprot:XP_001456118.1 hypothetical protein (macronuclear) [Paramecium tetraurelia strain d4-2]
MNQYSDINNQPQGQGEEPQELHEPNSQRQQNESSDIQNENEKYCGGLLNRSDHILVKALKLILALPLLPVVLMWRLLQCTMNLIIDCCTNQIYNCLLYIYGKIAQCLSWLSHILSIIFNYIYTCLTFICNQILDAIYFLGRCSKYILDWYAIFIINMIFKFAHLRSIIQEFTSFITIPLSLKIIVPLAMCFYNNIFNPTKTAIIYIVTKMLQIIRIVIINLYEFTVNYILIPFYDYVILSSLRFMRFLLVDVLYKTIIINFCKGLRWVISNFYTYILLNIYEYLLVKFLYRIVLTYTYKAVKFLLYDFLYKLILIPTSKAVRWIVIDFFYEILIIKICQLLRFIIVDVIYKIIAKISEFIYSQICVNTYRCSTWIIIEIIYKLILRNIYIYILRPLYNILVSIIRIISTNVYRFLLLPFWNLSKYLYNGLIRLIRLTTTFIYDQLLTPMWTLIVSITRGLLNLIKNLFTATKQLSIDLWIAIKTLVRRIRNII